MNSTRMKALVIVLFVVTLGAGAGAGILAVQLKKHPPVSPPSSLAEELSLSSDQREKMKKIWEDVRNFSDESLKESLKAERERDRKILALIPPEKIAEYNKAHSDYDNEVAGLKGIQKKKFDQAVLGSEKILTPEQVEKYRKILKKRIGAETHGVQDATP